MDAPGVSCGAMSIPSGATLRALVDRTEIVDLVVRFATAFDLKDWAALRACLASDVHVDYSAFRGEPARNVSADEFVASRTTALSGLRTQHLSTNHQVTVQEERAECL